MNKLLGNKANFAIEISSEPYRPSHHLMGKVRFWLGGNYLGAYEDINILSVTLSQLEKLTERNIDGDIFKYMDDEATYKFIKADDNLDGGKYFFSPGEAFDDFSIIVFRYSGCYRFIWKLNDSSFFEYENYPAGLLSANVEVKEVNRIIDEFRKQLDEFKAAHSG